MSIILPSTWISCSQYSPLPTSPDVSPRCVQHSKLVRSKTLGSQCSLVSFDEIKSEEDAFEYYEPPSSTSSDSCTAMEDFVMDITMDLSPHPLNPQPNYTFLHTPPVSSIAASRILKSTNRRKSPPPSIYTGTQPRRPVSYHRSSSSPKYSVHRSPSLVVKPKTPSTRSPTILTAPKSPFLVKVQINRSSPFSLPPDSSLPISSIIISKTPTYQSFHHQNKNYTQLDLNARRSQPSKKSQRVFSDEELEIFDKELSRFFGASIPHHPLPSASLKGSHYTNLDGSQDLLRCKSLGFGKNSSGNLKSSSSRGIKVDYNEFEEDWETSLLDNEGDFSSVDSKMINRKQSLMGSKLKFWKK